MITPNMPALDALISPKAEAVKLNQFLWKRREFF